MPQPNDYYLNLIELGSHGTLARHCRGFFPCDYLFREVLHDFVKNDADYSKHDKCSDSQAEFKLIRSIEYNATQTSHSEDHLGYYHTVYCPAYPQSQANHDVWKSCWQNNFVHHLGLVCTE